MLQPEHGTAGSISGGAVTLTADSGAEILNGGYVHVTISATALGSPGPVSWNALAGSIYSSNGVVSVAGFAGATDWQVNVLQLTATAAILPRAIGVGGNNGFAITITNQAGATYGDSIQSARLSVPGNYAGMILVPPYVSPSGSGFSIDSRSVAVAFTSPIAPGQSATVYVSVTGPASSELPAAWPVSVSGTAGGLLTPYEAVVGDMCVQTYDPPLFSVDLQPVGGSSMVPPMLPPNQPATDIEYTVTNLSQTAKITEDLASVIIKVPAAFTNVSAVSGSGIVTVNPGQVQVNYGPGALTPTGSDLITLTLDTPSVASPTYYLLTLTASTLAFPSPGLSLGGNQEIGVDNQPPAVVTGLVTPRLVPLSAASAFALTLSNTGVTVATGSFIRLAQRVQFRPPRTSPSAVLRAVFYPPSRRIVFIKWSQ